MSSTSSSSEVVKTHNVLLYVVFITNKIWAGLGLPQELDKLKNKLLDYPCYSCYNIMDSYGCQWHLNNVVSKKARRIC